MLGTAENAAIAKMKAAGTEIITDIDKSRQDAAGLGSVRREVPPWSSASKRSAQALARRPRVAGQSARATRRGDLKRCAHPRSKCPIPRPVFRRVVDAVY